MQVKGALNALESLGGALEDHLQLVLPAMVKLIFPGESVLILTIREQKSSQLSSNQADGWGLMLSQACSPGGCGLPQAGRPRQQAG